MPTTDYNIMLKQAASVFEGEKDCIANSANFSALLNLNMQEINWVGFYFLRGEDLVLGPFQGNPACVRIPLGKGVCGTAAVERKTIIVPNVDSFPGHIACDSRSKSEIVVPLIKDGILLGVLDIDSPIFERFDFNDALNLEKLVQILIENTDFSNF